MIAVGDHAKSLRFNDPELDAAYTEERTLAH